MSKKTIEDRLKKVIKDCLGMENFTNDSSFENDLGADSLDCLELVMRIEDEFSIEIIDKDVVKITSVGQALEYLQALKVTA